MAYFPFYIEINNKVCLIVGGGRIAFRKIEILLKFEAQIIIIAPSICDEIYGVQKEYNDKVILREREFLEDDISDAEFVVAATDNAALNFHISELCKKNNKLVNVVDVKEECSFIFPAIIKQEDLVVSISTGGSSPLMAAKIKQDIKKSIPDYYGKLIKVLGDYREQIKSEISIPIDRKQVYQDLIQLAKAQDGNITSDDVCKIISKYKE